MRAQWNDTAAIHNVTAALICSINLNDIRQNQTGIVPDVACPLNNTQVCRHPTKPNGDCSSCGLPTQQHTGRYYIDIRQNQTGIVPDVACPLNNTQVCRHPTKPKRGLFQLWPAHSTTHRFVDIRQNQTGIVPDVTCPLNNTQVGTI